MEQISGPDGKIMFLLNLWTHPNGDNRFTGDETFTVGLNLHK